MSDHPITVSGLFRSVHSRTQVITWLTMLECLCSPINCSQSWSGIFGVTGLPVTNL